MTFVEWFNQRSDRLNLILKVVVDGPMTAERHRDVLKRVRAAVLASPELTFGHPGAAPVAFSHPWESPDWDGVETGEMSFATWSGFRDEYINDAMGQWLRKIEADVKLPGEKWQLVSLFTRPIEDDDRIKP